MIEWAWEGFDEATAAWCFERLGPDEKAGWLHRRRDEWLASGQSWSAYVRAWAEEERLHSGSTLLRLLDERFQREHLADGPYFFPDLARATEEDERTAIEAGQIRADAGRLRRDASLTKACSRGHSYRAFASAMARRTCLSSLQAIT